MILRLSLALLLSIGLLAAPVFDPVAPAMAASKKTTKKKSDLSSAQREQILEYARALCKKKYGATGKVYRIDYYKKTVWCKLPGY